MRTEATGTLVHPIPNAPARRLPWAGLALAHGLNVLLAVGALILLLRGLAGGFSAPLAPAPFFAAVGLMSILAAGVRLVAAWGSEGSVRQADPAVRYAPGIALVAALAALAIASTAALPVIAGVAVVLLEEGAWWWWLRGSRRTAHRPQPVPAGSPHFARIAPAGQPLWLAPGSRSEEDSNVPARPADPAEPPSDNHEDVMQHVLRIEMPDGTLRWQGWCRTRFGPAARHAVEHLSFCPPFLHTPHVHCRPVSGPPVRLRVSRVLPHGASVELRLASASAEPVSVTFEFTAAIGSN